MKTILKYGQSVLAKKKKPSHTASVACFQSAVDAVKDGYALKDYERVILSSGLVAIRKRQGGK